MKLRICILLGLLVFLVPLMAQSAEQVGMIISLSGGAARIEREGAILDATVNAPLFQGDVLATEVKAVVKVLLTDDTVLTISERSRMLLENYLFAPKEKKATALLKLLFGKLRVAVGRMASISVTTDTAVAGVKGTVFEVLHDAMLRMTWVSVFEGIVELRNIRTEIMGMIRLTAGHRSSVSANEPPTPPQVIPLPQPGAGGGVQMDGEGGDELPPPEPPSGPDGGALPGGQTQTPPGQVPQRTTTEVNVDVRFP